MKNYVKFLIFAIGISAIACSAPTNNFAAFKNSILHEAIYIAQTECIENAIEWLEGIVCKLQTAARGKIAPTEDYDFFYSENKQDQTMQLCSKEELINRAWAIQAIIQAIDEEKIDLAIKVDCKTS